MNIDLKSPLLLVLELTNECNLNCRYCYTKKREKEKAVFSIPFEIVKDIPQLSSGKFRYTISEV